MWLYLQTGFYQSNKAIFLEFNMRRICVLTIILTLPERMEHYTLQKPFTTINTVQKLLSTQSMVISIGEEIQLLLEKAGRNFFSINCTQKEWQVKVYYKQEHSKLQWTQFACLILFSTHFSFSSNSLNWLIHNTVRIGVTFP